MRNKEILNSASSWGGDIKKGFSRSSQRLKAARERMTSLRR